MSTNGHYVVSADDINRIMDEWMEITHDIRRRLHVNILQDSKSEEEREFDIILTMIIPAAFPFGDGAEPVDLKKEDAHYMWNYPEFAGRISGLARQHKKTTRAFINTALSPRFTNAPNEAPLEALKRVLLMPAGRNVILKRLLGEDEVQRIDLDFKRDQKNITLREGTLKVSKKRRRDSSDDPEELKAIPEFTRAT